LYETTYRETKEAGYSAYEVSNYARTGHACIHNLGYWRYNNYIGFGPGAHSRVRRDNKEIYAVRQHSKPEKWLDSIKIKGHGTAENRKLQDRESAEEMLMMSLRLKEGLDLKQFQQIIGVTVDDVVNRDNMTNLINAGFLKQNSKSLYTTKKGTRVLNTVLGQLLAA
jgi:oxygen-independent coproporphyrinogen-3 oxidase